MNEITTSLSPQQQFEATIKDRLRSDIGSLLPDEALAEMLQKTMGIQNLLFILNSDTL